MQFTYLYTENQGHDQSYTRPYRFGFNGQEKDNEVAGTGNSYTTEFRQYDSRLGRWFSVDPEARKYNSHSPYSFGLNNPILLLDPEGDTVKIYSSTNSTTPILQINTDIGNNFEYTLPADFDIAKDLTPIVIDLPAMELTQDAYIISADAGFAFVGGASVGLSAVYINSGEYKGTWSVYRQGGGTLGANASAGVTAYGVDFNEQNSDNRSLEPGSFEGKSQGHAYGIGPFGGGTVTSYLDGKYCTNFDCGEILYEGNAIGIGVGGIPVKARPKLSVGYLYYFTSASLLGTSAQINPPQTSPPPTTPPQTPTQSPAQAPNQSSPAQPAKVTKQKNTTPVGSELPNGGGIQIEGGMIMQGTHIF